MSRLSLVLLLSIALLAALSIDRVRAAEARGDAEPLRVVVRHNEATYKRGKWGQVRVFCPEDMIALHGGFDFDSANYLMVMGSRMVYDEERYGWGVFARVPQAMPILGVPGGVAPGRTATVVAWVTCVSQAGLAP